MGSGFLGNLFGKAVDVGSLGLFDPNSNGAANRNAIWQATNAASVNSPYYQKPATLQAAQNQYQPQAAAAASPQNSGTPNSGNQTLGGILGRY